MAKATQSNRLMRIDTPLGKDYLLINSVIGKETISELYEFKLELFYDEEDNDNFKVTLIDPAKLLGQNVLVSMEQPDGTKRKFAGIINEFSEIGRNRQFTTYSAKLVPDVWKLTQNSGYRIFQYKSVPEIIAIMLEGFDSTQQLTRAYKPRTFCVQFNESDFDFLSRIMEEEGIFFYFDHSSGKERIIIRDDYTKPQDIEGDVDVPIFSKDNESKTVWEPSVTSWQTSHKLMTGKVTMWDYKFQLPKKKLDASMQSRFNFGGSHDMEHFIYPGIYATNYDGKDRTGGDQTAELDQLFKDNKTYAQNRMMELDSQKKVVQGRSDSCSFTAGFRFILKNHPTREFNAPYILLSCEHRLFQTPGYFAGQDIAQEYSNSFTCIPHGEGHPEFRPTKKTTKPMALGTQTAFVVGPEDEEIYVDGYGRVLVQFHWDRDGENKAGSSCWIRVAKDLAGNKYGSMFIPRIGQEVIVDFIGGDPDQPIITGSVYNPDTMPHYELPKYKTLSYIKTRTSPDDGKGFNELRFEDKQGKEQVFVHSQKRADFRFRGSFYETCGGNRQERVGVRSDNKPGGNLAITVGGSHDLHVKADEFIGVDGKLNEGVKGDVVEGYDGNQQTVVKSKVEVNAKEITLEGSQKVTLKVGSSCVIVDMMGITIQGPMVKINSGGAAAPTGPAIIDAPLDAESADTGEPGYLDRPRRGGGRGRTRRTLNGQHAPSVTRNDDGSYSVGGDKLRVEGNDAFVGEALSDLSTLYNTPTGKHTMDSINAGRHPTTIRELPMNQAPGVGGGQATPVDGDAAAADPSKGSGTVIEYAPNYTPQYTNQDGDSVDGVRPAVLGHEMIHADHSSQGNDKFGNSEPAEPTSNEEESQTIGIHGHSNDSNTENDLIRELGGDYQREDHDFTVTSD